MRLDKILRGLIVGSVIAMLSVDQDPKSYSPSSLIQEKIEQRINFQSSEATIPKKIDDKSKNIDESKKIDSEIIIKERNCSFLEYALENVCYRNWNWVEREQLACLYNEGNPFLALGPIEYENRRLYQLEGRDANIIEVYNKRGELEKLFIDVNFSGTFGDNPNDLRVEVGLRFNPNLDITDLERLIYLTTPTRKIVSPRSDYMELVDFYRKPQVIGAKCLVLGPNSETSTNQLNEAAEEYAILRKLFSE